MQHTVESLRAFEESIREGYLAGRAQGAVHLSRGNEAQLIEIFKNIKRSDWVFSTYRSHYHALLHGIPEDTLRALILSGHSISINSSYHRFFTSSIVGGCLPIAVGTALAIKRNGGDQHVWCFVGDMVSTIGAFKDAVQYSDGHDLPLTFVVEDNGFSTNTPTQETWGKNRQPRKLTYYQYQREWPHSGFKA